MLRLGFGLASNHAFIDGNKRASVIFANHYMISKGLGLLIIPEKEVSQFKGLLIDYYDNDNDDTISDFLKTKCWKRIDEK